LINRHKNPNEESAVGEGTTCSEFFVEFGVESGEGFVDVCVEDEGEDGGEGVDCCVAY
jgi:hypothetical protein